MQTIIKYSLDFVTLLSIVGFIIMAIAALRDIFIKSGFKPKSRFMSKWFNSIYEIQLLEDALKDMGYSKSETKEIFRVNKKTEGIFKKLDGCPEDLISLIVNYIYPLSGEKEYGNVTREKSGYYIHTMEMVHNKDNLKILTAIMYHLIITDDKRKGGKVNFVIVPKGGNPLLAKSVADELNADLLVLKGEQEESSLKISVADDPKVYFMINFEGGNELLKKTKEYPDKKLNGIVMDCNTSGGTQVFSALEKFNEMIDNQVINANYVKVAYVLFRADNSENKFDNEKKNIKKYRLMRYFDLDEALKEKLYGLSKKEIALDYKEEENIKVIDNLIVELKKSGKMHYKSKRKIK